MTERVGHDGQTRPRRTDPAMTERNRIPPDPAFILVHTGWPDRPAAWHAGREALPSVDMNRRIMNRRT